MIKTSFSHDRRWEVGIRWVYSFADVPFVVTIALTIAELAE
jgi:hypothetical protein